MAPDPRLRGDDEQDGVPHANFRNEVLVGVDEPLASAAGLRCGAPPRMPGEPQGMLHSMSATTPETSPP
jgi:hypothetical protein